MDIDAIVRRFAATSNNTKDRVRQTSFESLAVAQVEPANAEIARAGRRFMGGNSIIANGIAPVAAIPTTTATLALYNSDSAGGRCLVLDRIRFWLGSGTAAAGATLLATVAGPIASPPTAHGTGYAVSSASGRGTPRALWTTAMTIPAGFAWAGLISTLQLAAANVGQGNGEYVADGALIVPPTFALGIAILSGAGTSPLYGVSAEWSELELDLE